jgi:hypothetical protein
MAATSLEIRVAAELAGIAYTDERDDVTNQARQKASKFAPRASVRPRLVPERPPESPYGVNVNTR